MRMFLPLVAAAILVNCGEKAATVDDLNTIGLTLPNGQEIRVEIMIDPKDQLRGMMFRTEMKPGHGMLFINRQPTKQQFWMYQTLIPLDMIWMDSGKRIVEIVPNAPPCKTKASQCPQYGGHEDSRYVLELDGGMAQKYGLKLGQQMQF